MSLKAIDFAEHHFKMDRMMKYIKDVFQEYHDVYNKDLIEMDELIKAEQEGKKKVISILQTYFETFVWNILPKTNIIQSI